MKATKAEQLRRAAEAHTNLTTFASVVRLLEGGLYGDNAAAHRIIAICQREQQKLIRQYDAAATAALSEERP